VTDLNVVLKTNLELGQGGRGALTPDSLRATMVDFADDLATLKALDATLADVTLTHTPASVPADFAVAGAYVFGQGVGHLRTMLLAIAADLDALNDEGGYGVSLAHTAARIPPDFLSGGIGLAPVRDGAPYAASGLYKWLGQALDAIADDIVLVATAITAGSVASAAEPFALSDGDTLTLKVDQGGVQTATFNGEVAVSQSVSAPFNLEPDDEITVAVDGGDPQTATIAATAATVQCATAQPYNLTNGWTLLVSVNGAGAQAATFNTGDFVAIGAATAAEVAAVIETDIAGVTADVQGGKVVITSDARGTGSGVQITGGLANGAFAFDTDAHAGTGDCVDVDAVTAQEVVDVLTSDVVGATATVDTVLTQAEVTCGTAETYALANNDTLTAKVDQGGVQTATILGAAAAVESANVETFALSGGDTLNVAIDGGAPQEVVFAAVAAERVCVNQETYAITNGQTLTVKVDQGGVQTATFNAAAATADSAAETFALANGDVLNVAIDGGAPQTVTFAAAAATKLCGSSEPFALTDGMILSASVDGGGAQDATFNGAAAAIECATAEPYDLMALGGPPTFTVEIDGGAEQAPVFSAVAAAVDSGAETFRIENGETITAKVDQGIVQTATFVTSSAKVSGVGGNAALLPMAAETMNVRITAPGGFDTGWMNIVFGTEATMAEAVNTLNSQIIAGSAVLKDANNARILSDYMGTGVHVMTDSVAAGITSKLGLPDAADEVGGGDFALNTQATADEVATRLDSDFADATTTAAAGVVTISSDTYGTGSYIEVTGGTANAELGFSIVEAQGSGDCVDASAVTAEEIAAALDSGISGATVTATTAGTKVTITSDKIGLGSHVEVTGGALNTALGFNTVIVDGSGDAVNLGAATAAEVAAVLETDIAGAAAAGESGQVRLSSDKIGTGSHIEITGGTANAILGFGLGDNQGSGDFVDASVATAAEVAAVVTGLTGASAADVGGTVRITSALIGTGSHVEVTGGTANVALGFDTNDHQGTGDFVDASVATAAEVAAVLETDILGAAATSADGYVVLTSDTEGTGSYIEVTGGTANAELGFSTDEIQGSGDFVAAGAATAEEVAAVIDGALTGADASATTAGTKVTITSQKIGTGSHVEVTGGTANVALGFDTDEHDGTGSAVDLSAVTAAEIAALLSGFAGATATAADGFVTLKSDTVGGGSYIEVTGGNINAQVGFDTDEHSVTAITSVILTSDSLGTGSDLAFGGSANAVLLMPDDAGAGDAVDLSATTAAEAVVVLNADVAGATARATADGEVIIASDTLGATGYVEVTGGAANDEFSFTTAETQGTGDPALDTTPRS